MPSPQTTALAVTWRDGTKSLQGPGTCLHEDMTARVLGPNERLGAHCRNQAPVAWAVCQNQLCQLCILLQGIGGHAEWLRWIRSLGVVPEQLPPIRQAVHAQAQEKSTQIIRSCEAMHNCNSTELDPDLVCPSSSLAGSNCLI